MNEEVDPNPAGFGEENFDENELDLSVVNRDQFLGKPKADLARISDVDKVNMDLVRVEDGVNRTVRLLNRRVTRTNVRMNQISAEVNLGFDTVRIRIDEVSRRVEALEVMEREEEEIEDEGDGTMHSLDHSREHSPDLTQQNEDNREELEDPESEGEEEVHRINMLSAENNQATLNVFSGDSVIEFDRWARRFNDFMEYHGDRDQTKKLARLKIHLDGTPRRIFENLRADEKATVQLAIENLRDKLDSPQRRELTYQALAACKQRDAESVKSFLDRLIPLVEATSVNLTDNAREEILSRTLLEKLKPELSFILRTAGLSTRKNFEELCMQAQEAEIMLANTPKESNPLPYARAIATPSSPSDFPRGNFRTWAPTGGNSQQLGSRSPSPQPSFRQNSNQNGFRARNWNNQNGNRWRGNNRFNPSRSGPGNDRRWNSRVICHYCQRSGHIAYNCNKRRNDYLRSSDGQTQPRRSNDRLLSMVEELAADMHQVRLKQNEQVAEASKQVNSIREVKVKIPEVKEVSKQTQKADQPKIRGWERVASPSFLPLCLLLMLAVLAGGTLGQHSLPKPEHPMICQTQHQAMVWALPKFVLCPKLTSVPGEHPVSRRHIVYAPNSLEYSTRAWACRKVQKHARKFTTLSNLPIDQKMDPKQLEVNVRECVSMVKYKRCDLGTLKNNSGLWETENRIDLSPRMWLFGSFSWKEVSSENCYAFETKVDSHFGAKTVITPAGVTQDCPYEKGHCVLDDKTVLIWTPESQKMCRFTKIGAWDGRQMGKTWLSDDGGLGLTFSPRRNITDCGVTLSISDQGMAVLANNASGRPKRAVKSEGSPTASDADGIVTSSQLAAELTYLHAELAESINFAFSHSLRAFCDFAEDTRRWVESSYLDNPVNLARTMFSNNYLIAKRVGTSLMKVWPCVPLARGDYELRQTHTNGTCFEYLPISFRTEGKENLAFLDPSNLIISPSSRKAPCSEFRKIVVQVEGKVVEVDQISGDITEVIINVPNEAELNFGKNIKFPTLAPHAFHQLVLFNLTSIATHAYATNMVKMSEMTYKIHNNDVEVLVSLSEEWEEVEKTIVRGAIGDFSSLWRNFVTVVVVICGADVLIRVVLTFLEARVGEGRLGRLLFGRVTQNAAQVVAKAVTEEHELDGIVIGAPIPGKPKNWPPTVSRCPIIHKSPRTKSLTPRSTKSPQTISETPKQVKWIRRVTNNPSKCPIVIANVSGVIVRALLDTGSDATVAPMHVAQKWGVTVNKADGAVVGLVNKPVQIIGEVACGLNILGGNVTAVISVLENVPGAFASFDLILGIDTLEKFGKLTFDFSKGLISFNNAAAFGQGPSTSAGPSTTGIFHEHTEYGKWLYEFVTSAPNPTTKAHYKFPQDMNEMLIFIGVATYYKFRIPNFDFIAAPLYDLATSWQSNIPNAPKSIKVGQNQQKAYDTLLSFLKHLVNKSESPFPDPPKINRLVVSSSKSRGRANSAIIPITVNHKNYKCLADTGATLTIAPLSMAEEIGCALQTTDMQAMSASGHVLKIGAMGNVVLQIGGYKLNGPVHFVKDEHATAMEGYELLLGCDVFEKLPPITFDFANKKFCVGRFSIPMDNIPSRLASNLKVRAANHIVLKPGTQHLIKGSVEAFAQLSNPIMVDEMPTKTLGENLGIIPCTSKPENYEVMVIVCNPTNKLQTLYRGMQIAVGRELRETGNEKVLSEQCDDSICLLREPNKVVVDPSFKIDFSKSSVDGDELKKLKALCEEYGDVFSKSQYDLGSCTAGEHDIITTTEEPIASKPRQTPYKYREELQKHIDQLLASGVMIESDTPWVSNIVLVQKKDGGLRPCIDFRKLNEVTVPDHYPLPRLATIMEKVGNCRYYSSLDLSSGFLQIRLSERASRKCGLITEDKVFQMINLPFGLRNATSAFARCMAHVLSGLDDCVVAYVDDILVFTRDGDFEAHLNSLRTVFERFRRFNLKLSPKKCIFAAANMNFLGFTVDANGYTPSLSKIETIKNLPRPTNVKGVRHVVGMASFFRKHVPNFSMIVEPLTRLTKKEKAFSWGEEQEEAFAKVKQILSEKPVLIFPDYSKPFHIFTDASTVGQGGALMQKDEENKLFHAIAYCSRTLSMPERKWPPVQIELGAIIFALREFKPYIFMTDVELHCDHKPLAYLMKKAEAHPHLARWLVELQSYNIKIVHIAGKQNLLADALSRLPHEDIPDKEVENLEELEDMADFPVCLSLKLKPCVAHENVLNMTVRDNSGNSFLVDIAKEQREDMVCNSIIEFISSGNFPKGMDEEEKDELATNAEHLCVKGDVLYFHYPDSHPRIYLPISLRSLIFEAFHNSPLGGGHMNLKKTLRKCKKYYWPRMHADIVTWTRQCITCQLRHSPNPPYRAEMQMPPANTLFAKIGLDLAGPFPTTEKGNKHILNIICCFTKYVISVPIPDAKANTIAKAFFTNCYLKFGGCTELLTDNATAFTSDFFRSFCALLYINKSYATPHWSQGNAVTERSFRTFHNILAKYISRDEPNFDEYLDCANFCYNTSIHTSTNESPFFLMFGRDPIFCVDQILDPKVREPVALTEEGEFKMKLVTSLRRAWEAAATANRDAQLRAKAQYDKLVRSPTIKVGDRVLLRNYAGKVGTSKKFHLPWKGIFRVVEISGVLVTIVSCTSPQSNPRVVHINQLKKCIDGLGPSCTIPELPEEEKEALSEAEEVMNKPGYSHKQLEESQASRLSQEAPKQKLDENPRGDQKPYNLRPNRRRNFQFINLIVLFCFILLPSAIALRYEKSEPMVPSFFWILIGCAVLVSFQVGYWLSLIRINRQIERESRRRTEQASTNQ